MSDAIQAKQPVKNTMTETVLNHLNIVLELSLDLEGVTSAVTRTFFGNQPNSVPEKEEEEDSDSGFEVQINRAIDTLCHSIEDAIVLLKKL